MSFLSKSPRRRAASLGGTLRPGRKDCQPGRRWIARRSPSKPRVLPFRAPRSSPPAGGDPPPGLAGWQKPHGESRPGGVLCGDPRNRVGVHRPWADFCTTLPRTDFASGGQGW